MRPSIDWSTSTLSTLSMFISTVCRRIKPPLYTIRLSVTSISVVQRRNHALKAKPRPTSAQTIATNSETGPRAPPTVKAMKANSQRPMAGRYTTQCKVVVYATISPGLQDMINVSRHLAMVLRGWIGAAALMLRSSHTTGMYTRLFGPALALAPIVNVFGASGTVMARLVMKFGGTSVADLDRIRNVARHVKREVDAGYDVAVVVSAMAGVTNQLVEWCRQAAMLHDAREYDAVVATGEEVTAGLLAIVLEGMGVNARS